MDINDNEFLDAILGVDKKNEIFNLWYEVIYLRNILNMMIMANPSLMDGVKKANIESCRIDAQLQVVKRFPNCNIGFDEKKPKD